MASVKADVLGKGILIAAALYCLQTLSGWTERFKDATRSPIFDSLDTRWDPSPFTPSIITPPLHVPLKFQMATAKALWLFSLLV